jgi:hypothetical protein
MLMRVVGRGVVVVDEPSKYGLSTGYPVQHGKGELYDTAVFHQINCLVSPHLSLSNTFYDN